MQVPVSKQALGKWTERNTTHVTFIEHIKQLSKLSNASRQQHLKAANAARASNAADMDYYNKRRVDANVSFRGRDAREFSTSCYVTP